MRVRERGWEKVGKGERGWEKVGVREGERG